MTSTKNSVVVMLALALTGCPDDGSTSGSTTTDTEGNTESNSNSGTVSVTLDTTMSASDSGTDTVSTTATTTDATTESSGPTSEATVNPDSSSSDGSGSDSSGSESGSTTGDGGATIYDIQMAVIPVDTDVEVYGVVVTAVGTTRFWAEEPAGGEYSGIVVFAGMQADALGLPDLAIGDVVDITGTVAEYIDVTEIDVSGPAATLVVVDSGQALSPDVVDISVFNAPLTAEPWESTLVRIEGAPLTVTGNPNGNNEYPVSDGTDEVIIDNFIYDSTAGDFSMLGTGATFDAIQGPVNWFNDLWKIMPRADTDLEGYTAP